MDEISRQSISNVPYIEEFYEQWKSDPGSVSPHWRRFFSQWEAHKPAPAVIPKPATPKERRPQSLVEKTRQFQPTLRVSRSKFEQAQTLDIAIKQSRIDSLIYAYRDFGYLSAAIDPLGQKHDFFCELSHDQFGLSDEDFDASFTPTNFYGLSGKHPLRDIVESLKKTYTSSIGVEYMHIQNRPVRNWLQREVESGLNQPRFDVEEKLHILEKLFAAEEFEHFLHSHFIGQKRFSLEGGESLIPALDAIAECAPELGVQEIVLGMAHRGRLNVLANFMHKSIAEIFSEFEENYLPEMSGGDGDVKYHKGFSCDHKTRSGKRLHISLAANPSHLEIISPVVLGKVRAKQLQQQDCEKRRQVMGVILHGDAAFSGQGVVAETLNLSDLRGYKTGGTIHIIVNNQIGFTTSPRDSRSSIFPSDMAKIIQVPIFHVNGDDPEAVAHVAGLATKFRQQFASDVVIDLVCYRRHGHNEGDEPSFTQPQMYKLIKSHPSARRIYGEKLVSEGSLTSETIEEIAQRHKDSLQRAFVDAKDTPPKPQLQTHEGIWSGYDNEYSRRQVETGVDREILVHIATKLTEVPQDFHIHRKLQRILSSKESKFNDQHTVDWAFSESLAFGSLMMEGHSVRLSGQDSGRGTFSQRHAVWWDTETLNPYVPLNHIGAADAGFYVYDSPLSEVSVLGFEYGYSLAEPRMLVMWEGQFGDFVNGSQVIIDQFVAAAQSKWHRSSGLVMLLPHGYEGQGPEHSSAHLERFLQLCAENNMFVCNATTPAQYFHLFRRQIKLDFRMPLIVMTPKSLLRHPAVISEVDELVSGVFQRVIDDPKKDLSMTRRLIFCSGKIYYELSEQREKRGIDDVAIVRVEELHPFPEEEIRQILKKYSSANRVYWVQEEPRNRGAWTYMEDRFPALIGSGNLGYIGRRASASPATGSLKQHQREQSKVIDYALGKETGRVTQKDIQ